VESTPFLFLLGLDYTSGESPVLYCFIFHHEQVKARVQVMKNADYWIDKLALEAYPEGGYFREILRSPETLETLPEHYPGPRCFYTSIYYLLKSGQVDTMHRLRSDELWYYHAGSAMTLHVIYPDGRYTPLVVGPDLDAGHSFPFARSETFAFRRTALAS
jgi:predicted cupin superfamily sugar epimerase